MGGGLKWDKIVLKNTDGMSTRSNFFWEKQFILKPFTRLSTSRKPHVHTATFFGIKAWITCLHKQTHLRCSIWFSLRLSFHLILQMGWLRFKNVRWLAQEHTVNPGQAATLPQLGDGYLSTNPLMLRTSNTQIHLESGAHWVSHLVSFHLTACQKVSSRKLPWNLKMLNTAPLFKKKKKKLYSTPGYFIALPQIF